MLFKAIIRNSFNFCKEIIEKTPPAPPLASDSLIKLSKWISMKSLCSRKQAEEFIKLGLVRIDGKRVFENLMVPEDANLKAFTPEGIKVEKPVTRLWMINKPRGYICSHKDPQNRPNVYQLLPPTFKHYGHIVSVGRLDYNSQGLLLLTNDVKLKNLLQNPQSNLTRVYRVKVHGRVTPDKLSAMSKPLIIRGQQYGPLDVTVDRSLTTNVWINVSMKTGKNRQIRRIMQKCDLQVNKLIRLEYGKFKLNKLAHKQIRQLPISEGLERKLKIQKARQITKNRLSLIQIDIREKAIQFATEEQRKRLLSKQSVRKQDEKLIENNKNRNMSQIKMSRNKRQQDQSDSQDD